MASSRRMRQTWIRPVPSMSPLWRGLSACHAPIRRGILPDSRMPRRIGAWQAESPRHRGDMLGTGRIQVWRIRLDDAIVPPPTPGELARAARFRLPELAERYLKSHAALRDILSHCTDVPLDFALHQHGKPYLPLGPHIRFNLSHSHEMALVAVTLDHEVGVDIERLRPLPRFVELAERFFPPSEPRPANETDFFRQWT